MKDTVDVCIVGGGLSGACAAHILLASDKSVTVLDARNRVGGRLLTAESGGDLGGAWIWPQSEKAMQHFLGEIGVRTVPMHLDGETITRTPDGQRHVLASLDASGYAACGGGAVRVPGGAASVVQKLLPPDNPNLSVLLRLRVVRVAHGGSAVNISCVKSNSNKREGEAMSITCRSAILAAPPKVLATTIEFDPPLEKNKFDSMLGTQTWMEDYGKVSVSFRENWWRDLNMSAISIDQLGAVSTWWEACSGDDGDGALPTLAGFVTRDGAKTLQKMAGDELHDYILNSLQALYGVDMTAMKMRKDAAISINGAAGIDGVAVSKGGVTVMYKSWLEDPFTNQDVESNRAEINVDYGDSYLQQSVGPLFFAGTEAAHGSGHMEGAVIAAVRAANEVLEYLR